MAELPVWAPKKIVKTVLRKVLVCAYPPGEQVSCVYGLGKTGINADRLVGVHFHAVHHGMRRNSDFAVTICAPRVGVSVAARPQARGERQALPAP